MSEINNPTEYSISEVYFIIKKHIKLISIIFSLILFVSIYYTLLIKPVYKSTGLIMVSNDHSSIDMLDLGVSNEKNYIDNEITIINSRTTAELVVKKLLKSDYRNNLFLFGTKKYIPPNYRKYITFNLLDGYQDVNMLDNIVDDSMIENFSYLLKNSMEVVNVRNTDAINVSISSYDPIESALLTNMVIDVYKERDLQWITGEMSHLKTFLIDQLAIKEKELNLIEEKLKIFQEEESIFNLDDNSKNLLENLKDFETIYNKTLAEKAIIEERKKYLYSQLTVEEKTLIEKITSSINSKVISLREELFKYEKEFIASLAEYGKNNNLSIDLNKKITRIKDNIQLETQKMLNSGIVVADPIVYRQQLMDSIISINSVQATIVSKLKSYDLLINKLESKISDLPEKLLKYTRLERQRSIDASTFSFMKNKLEEARIGEASKLGKIRVLDKAVPIYKPISPNKILNMIFAIFLGIILGLFSAFIVEFFDNTIKSIEQIERRGLTVLSIIPSISRGMKNKSKRYKDKITQVDKLQRRLIIKEDPKSPISEAYRSLRTSLMYSKNNDECSIILVSSAGPGEGKTTTIANLAITYANLGKKTLLIDSDLRKPVVHTIFDLEKVPGLTGFLSSRLNFEEITNKTNVDNLDVITSGVIPPNPSELLDSDRMKDFFKIIKKKYDVVLFDSPPLIAVTDAFVLMKNIDQFILVVRAGVAQRGALDRVLQSVENSDYKICGVVMNAVTEQHSYGAGYYYNYYQYYYGDTN